MYTRLEAINLMLESTGQLPVTSESINIPSTIAAKSVLDRVVKREQTRGWWFNTEYNRALQRLTNNTIILPPNTIRVDLCGTPRKGVIRDGKLYDTTTSSYSWDADQLATIVLALPFEQCAPAFQTYVMYAAAREFQVQREGDQAKYADISDTLANNAMAVKREHTRWLNINMQNSTTARKYRAGFRKPGSVFNPVFPGGRSY